MEAVAYVAEQDATPEFRTVLWRFMQNFGDSPMRHKEMAARLERVGFSASENNVTQWLNGDRTPPPGLPYYATLALELEEEDGQRMAWAYSRSYKDNRKGAGRSGVNVVNTDMPEDAEFTEEELDSIADKREEYKAKNEEKRSSEKRSGGTGEKNGGASRQPEGGAD